MRSVFVSNTVKGNILNIRQYLICELKLSEEAAYKRVDRMWEFIASFAFPAAYPLCRFIRWQVLGYRCAVFEKTWVFAYEIFDDGIIVRDMSHTAVLIA